MQPQTGSIIYIGVNMPEDAAKEFENALNTLRALADKFPQCTSGMIFRTINELWPMASRAEENPQAELFEPAKTVHALESIPLSDDTKPSDRL